MKKIFSFREMVQQTFNIFVFRRIRFRFELLPYEVRGLTWKRISNFIMLGLNQFFALSGPFGKPVVAQIEPANFCNLDCPLCLTTSEEYGKPKTLLPLQTFESLIDEIGDYLLVIVLWCWGEPFLNPAIFDMIRSAKKKNIVVHSSTNGNILFDEQKAEALVRSGLDSLVFAVDGATQETYEQYRRGGDLERVKRNIKTILEVRDALGSKTPVLNLRFVVMKHNESEMEGVKKLAEELGVDYLTFKTVDMPNDLGGDVLDEAYAPEKMTYQRYEYDRNTYIRRNRSFACMRPWKRITMDAMGSIVSCEYDYKSEHSFGKLDEKNTAMNVWKGERAICFRRMFNLGNNDTYFCRECTYKNMVPEDCIVEMHPVGSSGQQEI